MVQRPSEGVTLPWGALMADWETVVLDIQEVFGSVWHRSLAEPWPWWRAMVLGVARRPDTATYKTHISPRLTKTHN